MSDIASAEQDSYDGCISKNMAIRRGQLTHLRDGLVEIRLPQSVEVGPKQLAVKLSLGRPLRLLGRQCCLEACEKNVGKCRERR